jgi:hypothetical protein
VAFAAGISDSGMTILDWTCLAIVAGCVQTIAIRLQRILNALNHNHAAARGGVR